MPTIAEMPDASSLLSPLADIRMFGQTFEFHDLFVVGLLVVLEGVLSIDNALVLGLLAKRLPKHLRNKALTYGLIGALVFRIAAIGTASYLLRWTLAKFLGGAYLVYVAVHHFIVGDEEHHLDTVTLGPDGKPQIDEPPRDAGAAGPLSPGGATAVAEQAVATSGRPITSHSRKFWKTVLMIELTDIAFA